MIKKILFKPFKINKPVYLTSLIAILLSIIVSLLFQEETTTWLETAKEYVTSNLGWFFIIVVNIILVYSIYIALSKYGKIRLGGDKAKPEFTTISWFAMLFSTGMGIGVMYFGVGEPVSHFINPPKPATSDSLKAIQSMDFTFLHWGFHAWAIYAIVGLALAFFSYNKKLPATFRSLFYPFLGNKIQGWWGHSIDILSVIATIFGLSATLGFGVQQLNGGLNFLFDLEISATVQSILIIIVVSIATLSVVSGLDKGLKYLSNGNMLAALIFMLFILFMGPTLFIFKSYVQNIGSYLSNIISLSTWNDSYRETGWQNGWTVFYWAWWISWSPFVGTFIARISRGRTIREFILGVLLVPAILTFLWMTVFGGTALHEIIQGNTTMVTAVNENMETALFVFLDEFPLTKPLSILALFLVALFFITSSDSGSLVVDNITSGNQDTPVLQRVLWAFIQGFIAIALLMGGGLGAIQTAVILTGLPFAAILLMMCYSLSLGLKEELNRSKKLLKSKKERTYSEIIADLLDEEQNKQ